MPGVLLRSGALALLMVLQACAGEDRSSARDNGPPPSQAPSPAAVPRDGPADAASGGAVVAAGDAAAPADAIELEHQRRLAEAQSYLDRATEDAQARHRLAIGHCQEHAAADLDACVATADESLQTELRAARVEFDAQMMQGQ